jgi:hypothetical protein
MVIAGLRPPFLILGQFCDLRTRKSILARLVIPRRRRSSIAAWFNLELSLNIIFNTQTQQTEMRTKDAGFFFFFSFLFLQR